MNKKIVIIVIDSNIDSSPQKQNKKKSQPHSKDFLLLPLLLFPVLICFFSETDDLAQYLDQLLTHSVPQQGLQMSGKVTGLSRFKAAASKTREMVSLMRKAKDLQIHSELCRLPMPFALLCLIRSEFKEEVLNYHVNIGYYAIKIQWIQACSGSSLQCFSRNSFKF